MKRCAWKNLESSEIYKNYHDNEWGVPSYNDAHLFETLVLESFHCGLSWLIVLKKREAFRKAFDNFNPYIICDYDENKINELMNNKDIVRNKAKILATIQNARSYLNIKEKYGSFSSYIWKFTDNKIIYSTIPATTNKLSDTVSKNLKKQGFKFIGSTTCYSYLEAIGIMNNHSIDCFKCENQYR